MAIQAVYSMYICTLLTFTWWLLSIPLAILTACSFEQTVWLYEPIITGVQSSPSKTGVSDKHTSIDRTHQSGTHNLYTHTYRQTEVKLGGKFSQWIILILICPSLETIMHMYVHANTYSNKQEVFQTSCSDWWRLLHTRVLSHQPVYSQWCSCMLL